MPCSHHPPSFHSFSLFLPTYLSSHPAFRILFHSHARVPSMCSSHSRCHPVLNCLPIPVHHPKPRRITHANPIYYQNYHPHRLCMLIVHRIVFMYVCFATVCYICNRIVSNYLQTTMEMNRQWCTVVANSNRHITISLQSRCEWQRNCNETVAYSLKISMNIQRHCSIRVACPL